MQCAAVHECEYAVYYVSSSIDYLLQNSTSVHREGKVIHLVAESLTWPKNIRLGEGRKISASLREQVAAEQRRGSFFHQKATFPCVGQMRRVKPPYDVLTQRQSLSIGEGTRHSISEVADRYQGSDSAAQWHRLWSGAKPFVERTALVGFHMGKSNVAKPLDRQNTRHGFSHEGKQLSRAGMEEQRFIIDDEILVEREPARTFDHNGGVNAIDPFSNLMHIRPGLPVRHGHQSLLAMDE